MNDCIATVGTFDGFHLGHQDLVRQLLAEAEHRSLDTRIITFSNHPLDVIAPGRAPKLLFRREFLFSKLENSGVNHLSVLSFDKELASLTVREFLVMMREKCSVKVLMMGFNNSFGSDCPSTREEYIQAGKDVGVEVIFAEEFRDENGITPTSSLLRKYVRDGRVGEFSRLSQETFAISGTVAKGKQNGRKLGFPTFNLDYDKSMEIPAGGVYKGFVRIYGEKVPAVINVGKNPTISDNNGLTIEAHAVNRRYSECYGEQIEILFVEKLRDEKKFGSLDELKAAIAADIRAAE